MTDETFVCPRANDPCSSPAKCRGVVLKDVLTDLGAEIREKCMRCLQILHTKSTTHRQAALNLESECNLPCRFWLAFANVLESTDENFDAIFAALRNFMRKMKFSGPPARTNPAKVFGRATTRDDLTAILLEQGHAWDTGFADDRVDELDLSLDEIKKRWSIYDLGRWVMWSTFNTSGTRPFEGIPREAQHIRGVLGLPRRKDEEKIPLLLIEYTLEDNVAHIPTIAEAYASDPWISYFRTAGEIGFIVGYGRTHARDNYDSEPGLPEVVHKPINGLALTERPEIVL